MASVTGCISIRFDDQYYSLVLEQHGWLAADMLQFLDDLYRAEDPRTAILKQLGLALQITLAPPPRAFDHWVEVDLEQRRLSTNSDLVRKAVKQRKPDQNDPYHGPALERIYQVLDGLDFTVELYR